MRKDGFAVTSVIKNDNTRLYARSRFVQNAWSTILISAGGRDQKLFQTVTGTITDGFASNIVVQRGGYLDRQIETAIAFAERNEVASSSAEAIVADPQPTEEIEEAAGSGSGFVVSESGVVLTNAHVIEGCRSVKVNGIPAQLEEKSDVFDLALLQVESEKAWVAADFAEAPAALNSDVTVVGYPLSGLLGGLNVTRGSVSSLKGLGGDITNMQISAAIQPGNSGGPVIDSAGHIVGIVVSKLDEKKFSQATGITPQNINFAIRSEVAKLFLFQNGVQPSRGQENKKLPPTLLAERASQFTVLVSCN